MGKRIGRVEKRKSTRCIGSRVEMIVTTRPIALS